MRLLVRFLAVVMLLAVAVGCATDPMMDTAGVERTITEELQPHLEPETITAVDCPDDIAVETGAVSTCVVHAGDTGFDVEVTQRDADGGIEFAPAGAVIVTAAVETDLDGRLHEAYDQPGDVIDLTVDCGRPPVRVLEVGDTFDCEVDADGTIFIERVSVVDTAGTVSYLVVE